MKLQIHVFHIMQQTWPKVYMISAVYLDAHTRTLYFRT